MKRWRIKRLDEWPGRSGPRNWASDMNEIAGCEITEEEYQKIHKDGSWCKYWFGILCSIHPYHLIEADENDFQLGDTVHCNDLCSMKGHIFEIIRIDSPGGDNYCTVHSTTWFDGHSASGSDVKDYSKVTNKNGCWNVPISSLTKLNEYEVRATDSKGLERGQQINISSQNISIASGGRFIGRRATDFECRDITGTSTLKGRRI